MNVNECIESKLCIMNLNKLSVLTFRSHVLTSSPRSHSQVRVEWTSSLTLCSSSRELLKGLML